MGFENAFPFEIIGSPALVYVAPSGTAFPTVPFEALTNPWTLVGTAGDLNYDDEGVRIQMMQTIVEFRALGDSGPRKAFRTEEGLKFGLTIVDMTLEQISHALNGNTVTDVPPGAEAGYRWIGLSRGLAIATYAMIARGPSPYGDDMTLEWRVPYVMQTGSPEPAYRKGQPAGFALEWTALVDPNAATVAERFGRIVAQDALAVS